MTKIVTAKDVKDVLRELDSSKKVVIDFWSPYCKPCEIIDKILLQLIESGECKDMTIIKVNAVETPEAILTFSVLGLPTLILYEDGKEKARFYGAKDVEEIKEMLKC
ncbi:thioredoxin family protein [Aeropyrum camini]|nr:thioredoxin family protein [Aeropyrum camini]